MIRPRRGEGNIKAEDVATLTHLTRFGRSVQHVHRHLGDEIAIRAGAFGAAAYRRFDQCHASRPDQLDIPIHLCGAIGLLGVGLGTRNVVNGFDVEIAESHRHLMLGLLLATGRPRQQGPFSLGEEVRHHTTAAQRSSQRLGQPLLRQFILILCGAQLGNFLAHKCFATDQRTAAEMQTERIHHELLGKDHAQIGGLTHTLAQTGAKVAPVDHWVQHLTSMLWVSRVRVLRRLAQCVFVIGTGKGWILAIICVKAMLVGIHRQIGIQITGLAQLAVGFVDARL